MRTGGCVVWESTHQVPGAVIGEFLIASKGLLAAASQAEGYLTSSVCPPRASQADWKIVLEFDSAKAVRRWRRSASHALWVNLTAKLAPQQSVSTSRIPWPSPVRDKPSVPRWKMAVVNTVVSFPAVLGTYVAVTGQWPDLFVVARTVMLCVLANVTMVWAGIPALVRLGHAVRRTAPAGGLPQHVSATQAESASVSVIPGDLAGLPTIPDDYRAKPTPGRHSPAVRTAIRKLDARLRTDRIRFRGILDADAYTHEVPGTTGVSPRSGHPAAGDGAVRDEVER